MSTASPSSSRASPNVDYRFGDRITALTPDRDGVDVAFASGATDRYDLVVGADGVRSGVRGLAFGPDQDYVRHLGAFSAAMPAAGDFYFDSIDQVRVDRWWRGRVVLLGGIGGFAPRTRAMIRMRALSMRMMTRWPARQLLARQFSKAEAITLPDYPALIS